jgi:hypothetical protein
VTWWLVTAPDEQRRCCMVTDGQRCAQRSVFRVASADGALDDYTYVCADHVHLVRGAGYAVTRIDTAE